MSTPVLFLALAAGLVLYAYVGYPLVLCVIGLFRPRGAGLHASATWPTVTIILPVYNEEQTVRSTLDHLLRLDYPGDRLEIVVVSDASSDDSDEIVQGFAERGVKLLRLPRRTGKTGAENAGRRIATGEIIVNTDASVQIPPGSLKPLIASFGNPSVAVASGRDVSVGAGEGEANVVEAGYVGYEMWIRQLETRVDGIIGTSGCFFATRASVIDTELPAGLSWDFAAPLLAREKGYRAVSVPGAVCFVPRAGSLAAEYRRKVRTIARGIQTLSHMRELLNPLRYGLFSWMLFSHKVCRWTVPAAVLVALGMLGLLSPTAVWARWLLFSAAGGLLIAGLGLMSPPGRAFYRLVGPLSFFVAGNVAALHAVVQSARGVSRPTWEPTRRERIDISDATSG